MEIPIHLLKGLFYLTTEELNKKLSKDNQEYGFYTTRWSSESKTRGIFFDLSQIRWINIGAATLLTLWIEKAKKADIQIYVALPYAKLPKREKDKIDRGEQSEILYQNKDKRGKANSFLKTIQFDRAIKCEHIIDKKDVLISEDFEYQSERTTEEQFINAFETYYSIKDTSTDFFLFDYKYIVPLKWIDSHNVEQSIKELEGHFAKVLANKERGIEVFDVLALKNVLLFELLKNVKEHAGENTKHGLLSIGLMSTTSLNLYQNILSKESNGRSKYTNNIEQDYIKWLFDSKFNNFIEIYFGDSGIGILDSGLTNTYCEKFNLKEEKEKLKILDWAFDKWSTSKKGEVVIGTKGLYRIKRIVDKYEGIVLVNTDNIIGGYQKGGHSPSVPIPNNKDENSYAYMEFPGTFIQFKLCPYKDVTKFNFDFKLHNINNKWHSVLYELNTEKECTTFVDKIKNEILFKEKNTLLVLKFKNIDIQLIQNTLLDLKHLSYIRHSNKIVVYLINNIGTDALGNITDSINNTIKENSGGRINPEESEQDFENICSPILLIGKENNIFWFGEDDDILSTLNEVYRSKSTNLSNLTDFNNLAEEKKIKVKFYLKSDTIISIDASNNIVFNFSDIQSIFSEQIKQNIHQKDIHKNENKELICSPKLNVVKKWYNIDTILKRKEGQNNEMDLSHFFALGLFLKFKEKYPDYVISRKTTHILIDHHMQNEIAKEFADLIEIDTANIINIQEDVDYNIPRRTQLFDPNDDVIIITTIVSSSETVRRLVKFTKRDLANPMIILCLLDKRVKQIPIETWGHYTDVLNLYQESDINIHNEKDSFDLNQYIDLIKNLDKCQTYISPCYKKEDTPKDYKIDIRLKEHFIKKKAVHYNHIGNLNNRHFTFYLDKQKILDNHSFIWEEFILKIKEWTAEYNIDKFTLIVPQYPKENTQIWAGCIEYIKEKFKGNILSTIDWDVDKHSNFIKGEDNFIFLDFGALTGNTLNKFIEILEFPKSILVIILFSQFQDNGRDFYSKVRSLGYSTRKKSTIQRDLFGDQKEEIKIAIRNAIIKILFLYNLPIDVYNSSSCPICEHERMLEYYRMNNKYMSDFCENRKKRLKIKSRKKTNEHPPCDFYYREDDENITELSSNLIMKMFELKLLLKQAISNTHNRKDVLLLIVSIAENIDEEISNENSNLYAFLYLISHEVLWLQKEPMVFREIRKIITHIAFMVAVKDITELINGFKNSENSEKQCEKIAVRYKYAAITVLRSANKSVFCENISKMVKSSIKMGGRLSNNLIQNIFYHINSLQVNSYNRRIVYFEKLKAEFESIEHETLPDNQEQITTFWDLKSRNNTILKSLEVKSTSTVAIFKHFRKEFLELYQTEGHPAFYEAYTALDFRTLDSKAHQSYLDKKENSSYYKSFRTIMGMLSNNWTIVKDTIIPIVGSFPKKIFCSEYFKTNPFFYRNFIDNKPSSEINLFSDFISTFTEDTLERENYDRYHELYGLIYKNLIEYRIHKNPNTKDSLFKCFLSDFDTNLKDSIDTIFVKDDFKDLLLNVDESIKVFYPKTSLAHYFKQIRDNILQKKNDQDKKLDNVSISFESEMKDGDGLKYIQLKISNTNTCKYQERFNPNPKGALYQFKEDLNWFEGTLNYNIENDLFVLTITFMSYENN